MHNIRKYYLAVRYWCQGDEWKAAVEYAEAIIKWTKQGV